MEPLRAMRCSNREEETKRWREKEGVRGGGGGQLELSRISMSAARKLKNKPFCKLRS